MTPKIYIKESGSPMFHLASLTSASLALAFLLFPLLRLFVLVGLFFADAFGLGFSASPSVPLPFLPLSEAGFMPLG